MEDRSLHIVIVGHVDHGKSTLVGRLFYDTGSLPPEKLEEIKQACESLGRELEFAYVMDNLEEERSKGITIDIAHTFFTTSKRRYVIIDAPGHKEFLKNMLSGTSQAEAAVVLVDVTRGIEEQTLRHCYLLSLLGIRQVAVLVNKMDLAGYSEEKFGEAKEAIESVFSRLSMKPTYIIPISASKGVNVAKGSGETAWYKGPTLLSALDSFEEINIEESDLRFPVQDIYALDGAQVAVGRVEAGSIRQGQEVIVLPEGTRAKVSAIRKFMQDGITEAPTGDCVGIEVDGGKLRRGQVLADRAGSMITDRIRANIFWMVDQEYRLGIPVTFRCATQEVKGRIDRIHRRFDPASVELVEKDASVIKPAEVAEVEIALDAKVTVDSFTDIPEMGRFVLEHMGHPVAGGIII